MCTLLTVDRAFYNANTKEVEWRIKMDASINRDGFALCLIGEKEEETLVMQLLDLSALLKVISTNTKWTRMFLHSRASTTSTTGIFGCHNFSSVGNGIKDYTKTNQTHWLVQHNGCIVDKEAGEYMVDSMLIAAKVNAIGVEKTIEWLLDKESYANVFFINPRTGDYKVVRCLTNTLYMDGKGNFSTKICKDIKIPVPHDQMYEFKGTVKAMTTYSYSGYSGYSGYGGHSGTSYSGYRGTSGYGPNRGTHHNNRYLYEDTYEDDGFDETRWKRNADGVWRRSELPILPAASTTTTAAASNSQQTENIDDLVMRRLQDPAYLLSSGDVNDDAYGDNDLKGGEGRSFIDGPGGLREFDPDEPSYREYLEEWAQSEIDTYGKEEVILYQSDDEDLFRIICKKLGLGTENKIPNNVYSQLTQQQKGWFVRYKEEANRIRNMN